MSLKYQMDQVTELQQQLVKSKEREKELLELLMNFWADDKEEWEKETSHKTEATSISMR